MFFNIDIETHNFMVIIQHKSQKNLKHYVPFFKTRNTRD